MSSRIIVAECDGRVLIPKEPLDLPVGARVQLRMGGEPAGEEPRSAANIYKRKVSLRTT